MALTAASTDASSIIRISPIDMPPPTPPSPPPQHPPSPLQALLSLGAAVLALLSLPVSAAAARSSLRRSRARSTWADRRQLELAHVSRSDAPLNIEICSSGFRAIKHLRLVSIHCRK
jgi:hypothetical protein